MMLDPDGKVVSWNKGAERIKGYRSEEILGQSMARFYTPEDIAAKKPELELSIARSEGRFEEEGWRVRKDGSRFWANVIISVLHDAKGRLRGFGKVTRDVSEQRRQQEVIRALSTPVLQVRERLLIIPMIGEVDAARSKQVTAQLLRAIRSNRAKVVVMDITGVPDVDSRTANHFVQTVEAARLLGATMILTGLSPEIAQTLVVLGVDLSKIITVSDLQGGIEQAEALLGYRVSDESRSPR